MTLIEIADLAIAALLVIGAVFTLIGSFGLLKLDDPTKRLHAPTKAGTLGVGALLAASMLRAFVHHEGSLHEILIMAFLFVTAPISAHFIAKVHLHQRRCIDPPAPPRDATWAVLDAPGADADEAPKTP
ncbi:Na+/H+ antiporter subunit G [Roseivivax sp. CAU 1761]